MIETFSKVSIVDFQQVNVTWDSTKELRPNLDKICIRILDLHEISTVIYFVVKSY